MNNAHGLINNPRLKPWTLKTPRALLRTESDLEGFFFKNDRNIIIFWSVYHLDKWIRLRKKNPQKIDLATLFWAIIRQNTLKIARFKKAISP